MYPRYHVYATVAAAVPLRAAGVSWTAIGQFCAASILLDADHYLAYVWRKRDLSLRGAYRYHLGRVKRDEARFGPNPHIPRLLPGRNRPAHALIVMLAALLMAALLPVARPLAGGMLFHRLQDYLWESSRIGPGRDE